MTKLYDMHMHTRFSGDSEADPYEMIAAAKSKKLSGLIFTDHMDLDYWVEPHLFDLDLETYLPTLSAIASECSDDSFHIGVGMELGLQEHLVSKHQELLSNYDFDFIIGSIHQVNKQDPYYDSFYDKRDAAGAFREYLEATYDNLNAFHDIDTLGHLDYIVRYAKRFFGEDTALLSSDFPELLEAIYRFLIAHDISLEVNTGAYRCGLTEPNPSIELLQFYYDCGGRAITIGADAHKPEHVGLAFEQLPELLRSVGFTTYRHYQGRTPSELPL